MSNPQVQVLWAEAQWRCVYHPGFAGQGRLEVYRGELLVSAESTPSGVAATHRGEVLRQRVIRGDLSTQDSTPPV